MPYQFHRPVLSGIFGAFAGIVQFNAPPKAGRISCIISTVGTPDNIYVKFSGANEAFSFLGHAND